MLFINIGIAALGLAATLSAFGGDTWNKGQEPLLKRVTIRGWMSLLFLVGAFSLGITKEVLLHRSAEAAKVQQEKLIAENRDQRIKIEEQVSKITTLQAKLDEAAQNLDQTAKDLGETTETIGEQQLASIEAAFKDTTRD